MTDAKTPMKILVAMPTSGINPNPHLWLKSYLNIINDIRSNGFTHANLFPYRMTWFAAMNQIFDVAFAHGFDYILRIDDDVWGHGDKYFSRLYEAQKDVIGACYVTRYFPYALAALNRVSQDVDLIKAYENKNDFLKEASGRGIQQVDLVGFGMTLIRVAAFRLVPRPLFPEDGEICPDDTYFAKVCLDNGIKQYVDMDMPLAHQHVTILNRMYLLNSDSRALIASGVIRPNGSAFHNQLIDFFGEDGKKDPDRLKAMS